MAPLINEGLSRRSVLCAAVGAAVGAAAASPGTRAAQPSDNGASPAAAPGTTATALRKSNLRMALINASWPKRSAEEVFQATARLGFESIQCHLGIDSGWLQAHLPSGPETGPWLAKRIASTHPRGAQFHLDPDHPQETIDALQALRSRHHLEIVCLYTGFQAHWLDVLVPVARCAQRWAAR